ncbi:hypothetical protein C8R43DRAFT_951714 [Mycena crocata]|nr:hypothetical protein C8R43DRAFT_951714 [Mycena crocata]
MKHPDMERGVEERLIHAQAQVDSIRDRYHLSDDDLAFEADMSVTEDQVVWEEEVKVLEEERQHIVDCIEHSERHCQEYIGRQQLIILPELRSLPVPRPATPPRTMPKKRLLSVCVPTRRFKSHIGPGKFQDVRASRAAEIRERRRLELSADVAKTDVKTWVSESWNADMDCSEDGVDGVSMDLGYEDEKDNKSDSESFAADVIVCERSYANGDPREVQWDNLTKVLWANVAVDGVRRSLKMEHPSHAPSSTTAPKVRLFDELLPSCCPADTMNVLSDGAEVVDEEFCACTCGKPLALPGPTEVNEDRDCIRWFEVGEVVVVGVVDTAADHQNWRRLDGNMFEKE